MSLPLIHAIAVLFLTGLIWTIQLVVYPGFRDVEKRQWPGYHQRHSRRIAILVLPPMIIQLGISAWLAWNDLNDLHITFFALSLFTWVITALVFLPLHQRIGIRPTEQELRKLTKLNWLRTLAWTACAVLSVLSIR